MIVVFNQAHFSFGIYVNVIPPDIKRRITGWWGRGVPLQVSSSKPMPE